jgi:septum formation protein
MRRPDRVTNVQPVILASASSRRRDLLSALGISFWVIVADVDETAHACESPEALAVRLARIKALAVAARVTALNGQPVVQPADDVVILAADTVVALGETILGKPGDETEARAMLTALRGRAHRVVTGLVLVTAGEVVWSSFVQTTVWMRRYSPGEVSAYIASGRPLDKAGAYGIQDADFRPVERIDGCYTNVVGLPLCEVERALGAIGYPLPLLPAQCDRWALDSTSQRPT